MLLLGSLSPALPQIEMTPIRPTPEGRRALNSQTDVLGLEVLAGGEPSFARVARYFPEMLRTRVPLSVREHPDEFILGFDGTLNIKDLEIDFRTGDPPNPYGIDGSIEVTLLDGYLPIPQVRWSFEGLQYEETAFAYSKDFSPGEPLEAYVRFRVSNPADSARPARVTIYLGPSSRPGPNPSEAFSVPAHGSGEMYWRIPYRMDVSRVADAVSGPEFENKLSAVRSYWTDYVARSTQIQTPEPFINNAYRAWLIYNSMNVDKVKDEYEIHDGSGFYEEVYGYSAALYCQALSLLGYFDDAQKYLESMLAGQKPNGQYISIYGTPDNGALLFAMAQQYRLSRRGEWLRKVAPRMIRAMEWIRQSRDTTRVMENGRKPVTYGLLPAGPAYCDFQNLVVSYYSDAYNWLGMHEAAVAFEEAGLHTEAARWLVEADSYHEDILNSMRSAVIRDHGIDVLPIEPLTHRLMKQGSSMYYSLVAPLVLETEFFTASDPDYRWITDFMETAPG